MKKKEGITVLAETISRKGTAIMVYVDTSMAEAVKIIGGGKTASGLRHILKTYENEIYNAAKNPKKAC